MDCYCCEIIQANNNAFELAKQVKLLKEERQKASKNGSSKGGESETSVSTLQKMVEELTVEMNACAKDKQQLSREIIKLESVVEDLERKVEDLTRENVRFSGEHCSV